MPTTFTNVRVMPSFDTGAGGTPFLALAPHPGFVLVGLRLRVGDWIDQVTPIFAELFEDGKVGPEIHGYSFGGEGGHPVELRVDADCVVTGIQTRSGAFLDGVRLFQTRWSGSLVTTGSSWTQWITGTRLGGAERADQHAEPRGSAVLVGIAGRSGRYVDGLSGVSGDLHRFNATAVAAEGSRRTRATAAG